MTTVLYETVICYMDGVEWEHHIGQDPMGTKLYESVESLKECEPHVVSGGCGIVEVEVRLLRWVEKQDLKCL